MKLKKLLALTLAGAVLTVSLTACTPLEAIELMYDWLFGGGSSNASHSNGTGVEESKTLEENIIQRLGLTNTPRHEDVAEPVLQEVAKSFDPDRWYNNSGELNDTAQAALDAIVKDKLTANGLPKRTEVDVWEVQPSQTDAAPSPDRKLYEDEFALGGDYSNIPTHIPHIKSYSDVKSLMEGLRIDTFDLYAGVFQKNGKTYAAMVIIWKHS